MKLPPPLPRTKRPLMMGLSLLFAALSTGCASNVQTVLSQIPVDQALRSPCGALIQPADPVTPSSALQFGRAAAENAQCNKARADGLLRVIDLHNEAATQ